MKVYTKGGDKGKTSLIGGERVGKDDLRVEAYGTADELSAFIALLRDKIEEHDAHNSVETSPDGIAPGLLADLRDDLQNVLGVLMYVQASLAGGKPLGAGTGNQTANQPESYLEHRIDELSENLPPIERFTLPGGHPLLSLAHVCRTVCRRAERCAVRANANDPAALRYINRLSDYLYITTRTLTQRLQVPELYWEP